MADEESPRITVTVKTPKEKHDVNINADAGVKEVRIYYRLYGDNRKWWIIFNVEQLYRNTVTCSRKLSCAMIQQYDVYLTVLSHYSSCV